MINIELLLIILILCSIALEYYKRIETTPLIILSIVIVSIVLNLREFIVLIALILPIYKISELLLRRSTRVLIGTKFFLDNIMLPIIYIVIGLTTGYYLKYHTLPYLSNWSSSLIFLTIIFSFLTITITQSIGPFTYIADKLFVNMEKHIKILETLYMFLLFIVLSMIMLKYGYSLGTVLFMFYFIALIIRRFTKTHVLKNIVFLIYTASILIYTLFIHII